MKTCFKCGIPKNRSEFYPHPRMGDGLLGKCKDCTKVDAKKNYVANHARIVKYERMRLKRLGRKSLKLKYEQKHRQLFPEKYKARIAVNNALRDGRLVRRPCEVCSSHKVEAHHEDYSKPLEVRWLCLRDHRIIHGNLVVTSF